MHDGQFQPPGLSDKGKIAEIKFQVVIIASFRKGPECFALPCMMDNFNLPKFCADPASFSLSGAEEDGGEKKDGEEKDDEKEDSSEKKDGEEKNDEKEDSSE